MTTNPSLHYRLSGSVSIPRLVPALLVGLGAVVMLSGAYVVLDDWIPLIYARAAVAFAFGALVGWVALLVIKHGHVRSIPLASLLLALVVIFALYAQWVFYIHVVTRTEEWVVHPRQVWSIIGLINEQGLWSIRGTTFRGAALAAVWASETAIVGGMAFWAARELAGPAVYCETCGAWAEQRASHGPFPWIENPDVFRRELEMQQFSSLVALTPMEPGPRFSATDVASCAECRGLHVMKLFNAEVVPGEKGPERKDQVIFENVRVPASVMLALESRKS
ncbi:MAG: hypothetical protein AB2A00_35435 [Myxococcota bacterium]